MRFGVFKYFTNKIVFFHVHTLAEGEAKSKQKEEWYKEKDQNVVCQWDYDASTIGFLQETNQISFSQLHYIKDVNMELKDRNA